MFLDLVEEKALPIVPVRNGVQNCFLSSIEYITPEGQNPRVAFTVTQKLDKQERKSNLTIWDPTNASYDRTEENMKRDVKNATEAIVHLVQTYTGKGLTELRTALTEAQAAGRDVVNQWSEFAKVLIEQLPADYSTKVSTWKLIYPGKKANIGLPKFPPFVALGVYAFKWDDKHDHLVAETPAAVQPDQFGQVTTGVPLEDLF